MPTSTDDAPIELSIIIKTLNEAKHIQRTIHAARAAAGNFRHEIIVADSLSDDETTDLAMAAGAQVVQLLRREDRSCGVGAQLGYQIAGGQYVYLLDGDMECIPGFVDAAIARLQVDAGLAGVAGDMAELAGGNYEFEQRRRVFDRFALGEWHGEKDWLDGGGIYKRVALDALGYVTDRNLHAYEEKDLGFRLRSNGWRLLRIPVLAVRHRGHVETTWKLLKKRWRSRYVNGSGELLRACLGTPHFHRAVLLLKQYVLLAFLIVSTVISACVLLWSAWPLWACMLFWLLAASVMVIRKGGVLQGIKSLLYLVFWSAGLMRGVVALRVNPMARIDSRRLSPDDLLIE
jgi:glycosyltransferase involved in cell wall biosynthesis